jgi:hypothetical protein
LKNSAIEGHWLVDPVGANTARSIVDQQKQSIADQIGGVAGAVRAAAQEIERGMPKLAPQVRQAAESIDSVAAAIRSPISAHVSSKCRGIVAHPRVSDVANAESLLVARLRHA